MTLYYCLLFKTRLKISSPKKHFVVVVGLHCKKKGNIVRAYLKNFNTIFCFIFKDKYYSLDRVK